VVPFPVTLNDP